VLPPQYGMRRMAAATDRVSVKVDRWKWKKALLPADSHAKRLLIRFLLRQTGAQINKV